MTLFIETLFPAFEEFTDKYVQEFKEFPGWVWVILTCKYLCVPRIVPGVTPLLHWLGSSLEKKDETLVGAIALTLFILGDIVDKCVFPREAKEGERLSDTLRSFQLLFAGWGLLLLVSDPLKGPWKPVFYVRLLCLCLFLILLQIKITTKGPRRPTGWLWLGKPVLAAMENSRKKAQKALGIKYGVYSVTKSIATSANQYRWRPMIENELAKFLRTAILPLLAWAAWFFLHTEWWCLGAALAGSGLSFFAYSVLKTDHMRHLYARVEAIHIVEAKPKGKYRRQDLPRGEDKKSLYRVFLWDGKIVATVDLKEK